MRGENKFLPVLTAALVCAIAFSTAVTAQVKNVDKLSYPALRQTEIPKPTRVVLDNGLVVMFLEDHELPLIDVSARIRTGSRFDPEDKIGLASLTGSTLRTGGTKSMTGDELDDFLEGRAAFVETGIGTTAGTASMGCLKTDFADVLKVFADVLRNPRFDEDKLKVAKTQMEAGIARQNDNAQGILFREFGEIIYGEDSPYAWNETYETVSNVSRDDLIAWHKQYYHPNQIILGIAGDFDTAEARKLVEQTFGDWSKGPEFKEPEVRLNTSVPHKVFHVEKEDINQSNILMGHLGIETDNPDYYAVEVMNHVLSGSFASRLFANVRSRKGLAYAVSGSVGSNWDYPGTVQLFTTTKTETTAAAIDALFEEARNMTALPPTDEEVDKAKASLLNSFVFNYDSTREILGQQLTYEYYGYPLDWLERYNEGIRKVTSDEVLAAAEKYIHPDKFAILVVGPSEGRDRPLSEFGEVAMLDISIPEPVQEEVAESVESLTKGRELVALALDGMGGAERVDSVKRYDQKGSMVMNTPQGEMEIKTSILVDYPDRVRQELTLPFGKMTMVITSEGAFIQAPQGTQPMPESQRKDTMRNLMRDPLMLFRQRSDSTFKANAVGADTVDGTAVEKVVIEFQGEPTTYGVDPTNGHILMMTYRGNAPMIPTPGEIVRTFSDFRTVDGLVFPFAMSGTFNGEPSVSATIESLTVDGPLDETAFAMPQGDAAEQGGGR